MALERTNGPTVLALTRQTVPAVRLQPQRENLSSVGAYEISPAPGEARATLFASGSEVEIALAAQKILNEQSFAVRVVSVPSLDLFLSQPESVRARVIGKAPVKVAIEAAV